MAGKRFRTFGSGRAIRRRSGKPKTKVGQMLYKYWQPGLHNQDFASLASGADTGIVIVDHSADFPNSIVNFRKLTLRWHFYGADLGNWGRDELLIAVHKVDQDDSPYPALDSEEVIEELRRDGKMIRGPWIITTPGLSTSGFIPQMTMLMKPIILKNLVLGPEEDLIVSFTNLSNAAMPSGSQTVRFYPMGFYRKMPV